jgi:peptidoglycan/LPS O-acetylase OafA/YrhL
MNSRGTGPGAATSGPSQKLLGLEIVRFVSAVAVLFWHYQNLWSTQYGKTGFVREAQPLYHYFSLFYQFGLYGVQVFWSISGYIFFWKYREAVSARRVSGKTFFLLRFSRLYPLHFATLVLVAALQMIYVRLRGSPFVYGNDDLYHFALQLIMASNWSLNAVSSFNGPIWSISIEVLVYVLFFVVLRYLGASLLYCAGIIIAAAAAYVLSHHSPVFQCVVCFYVGGVTATLAGAPAARKHGNFLRILSIAILIAVPVAGKVFDLFQLKQVDQAVTIGYIAVLLYFMAEHCAVPASLSPAVQIAGNMTYSSYLIHYPVQLCIAIVCAAAGWSIPKESLVFFLAYMAAILLLAAIVFRYFEMPCQLFIRGKFRRPA